MITNIDLAELSDTLKSLPSVFYGKDESLYIDSLDISVCGKYVSDNTIWTNDGQPSSWTLLLFSICVPLFVVFLEKWVTQCIKNKEKKNERKIYRQTIADWIKLIHPIETNLTESLNKLSSSIVQSDDMQPERYALPSTIPDKLGSLTVEQMMDAFLTDFKGDKKKCSIHIYNIISCMDYLSKTRIEITKAYDAYNKQAISCCEQWNNDVSLFKEWYMKTNDTELNKIVKLWAASLIIKKDSIQAHEKLVDSILHLYGTEIEIASNLIKMKIVIQQRQALSNSYAVVFADLSKNITTCLEQLSKACVFFEDKKSY